jgi:hypothetical protein
MPDIFRQALKILDKRGRTEEEDELLAAALIPLDLFPQFNELTTREGLKLLSKMIKEEKHGNTTTRRP